MPLPRTHLIARLVSDPELKFGQSGTAVAKLRLVASDRKKNDAGEWVDSATLWTTAKAFGRLAENITESLKAKDLVVVVGSWRTEEWVDQEQNKRSAIVLLVDDIGPSLQFRTLPHHGGVHEERARSVGAGSTDPWEQPGQSTDSPPF